MVLEALKFVSEYRMSKVDVEVSACGLFGFHVKSACVFRKCRRAALTVLSGIAAGFVVSGQLTISGVLT